LDEGGAAGNGMLDNFKFAVCTLHFSILSEVSACESAGRYGDNKKVKCFFHDELLSAPR
jgi:hypothetical protein